MANHLLSVARTTSSVGRPGRESEEKDGTGDGDISQKLQNISIWKYVFFFKIMKIIPQTPTVKLRTDCANTPTNHRVNKDAAVGVQSLSSIKQEGGTVLSKPTMCKLNKYFGEKEKKKSAAKSLAKPPTC